MRRESLNTKILILTISLFVICSLLYGVFFSYQSQNAIMDEFIKRGTSLVKNLSLNAELEILIENRTALKTLAANLLQEKEVQAVKIMNDNRQLLVDLSKPDKLDDKYKETLSLTVTRERDKNISDRFAISLEERENVIPDENGKQTIGYVEVVFSKKGIFDTINIMRRNMLFLAILATIIGCTLSLYFSTSIVKPVRRLAKATTRIAEGDWETKLPIDTLDEVGQLTDSFNKMSDALIMKREELEDTYKELANRERMAEIGNFSMMIAHELKNPLGIIKGSVDIIAKDGTKAKVRDTMIEYIQDEVKRLNRLVEDFLSFARPNPAHKSLININQMITRIINLIPIPEFKEKEISLNVQLSKEISEVNIDEHQINQAIVNLTNNAIQAIPEKGEIILKTGKSGNGILITIMDTGIGIPDEEKEKVFEPFFTKKQRGTGLGLAVVKKIIDNHRGEIKITDRENGGTAFSLWLPMNS